MLLLILPRGSALHSPEKTTTEMISTRLDNSNKIHPCTAEKKGMVRGYKGEGLEGEGLEGKGVGGPGGGVSSHTA